MGIGFASLRAQDSESGNPTGPTGDFNGEVTTGGSYDPYTLNAKRSVTDLVVPGSNGTYPLALTRTYNSGYFAVGGDIPYFGDGGNWRHSYMWTLATTEYDSQNNIIAYTVAYPSGAAVTFRPTNGFNHPGDIYWRGPTGTQDRLEVTSTNICLHTTDGGLVYFGPNYHAASIIDPFGATTKLTYDPLHPNLLQKVTEPGGRWLQFTYASLLYDGRDVKGRAVHYRWTVLNQLQASTNQTVTYNYRLTVPNQSHEPAGGGDGNVYITPYCVLDHVVYNNESSVSGTGNVTASYTYTQMADFGVGTIPLIETASDPHYSGSMASIRYQYLDLYLGYLQEEQNYNTSECVSHVDYDPDSGTSIETRGDQAEDGTAIKRKFCYGLPMGPQPVGATNAKDGQLTSSTDFEGHTTYLTYYDYGQTGGSRADLRSVTDTAGHSTVYTHESYAGKVNSVTLPDGRTRTWIWLAQDQNSTLQPYYLYRSSDERGQTTTYLRDHSTGLVTEIDYPDNTKEFFTYAGFAAADGLSTYYKISTHTNKLGAVTQYSYGQNPNSSFHNDMLLSVTRVYNEADGGPQHSELTKFEYDALDRLVKTTDPRAVATQFAYNARHQLVTTTHVVDGTHIDRSYDDWGNCTSVSDELQHVATTAYDEYRRPTAVTVPVNNDSVTARTSFVAYDPRGFSNYGGNIASATSHTRSAVGISWTASGKATAHVYSPSGLRTGTFVSGQMTGIDGNGNPTFYLSNDWRYSESIFDPVSQIGHGTDANGNTSYYALDLCGRKSTTTDPLGHVSTWTYYGANEAAVASGGNPNCAGWLKSVSVPGPDADSAPTVTTTFANYDVMGRVMQSINPKSYSFFSGYDAAGDLMGQTDGAQPANNAQSQAHRIGYGYDTLGRKSYVTNPLTGGREKWTYDKSGNVSTYTNYDGAVCTYLYDGRNRCLRYDWSGDGGVTAPTSYTYDNAGRITQVLNWHADVHYTYDDSGALITEQQKIYPSGSTLTTTYHHDADGNVQSIQYPGGKTPTFAYDLRERCKGITLNNVQIAYYHYDGNLLDYRQCGNTANTTYTYQCNRVVETDEHRSEGNSYYLTSDRVYGHAPDGQISWWYRKPMAGTTGVSGMENGRGDAFRYDLDGSLINAARDVLTTNGNWPSSYGDSSLGNNVSYANGSPITNDYGYVYDAAGNRTSVTPYVSAPNQTPITYSAKGDNEYQSYTQNGATLNFFYDNNFNLQRVGAVNWLYTYDAENHLTSADNVGNGQHAGFNYDGLGRLVEQVVNGTTTHFYYAGSQRIEERDGNDALIYSYFFDGPSGDSLLCRKNALGTNLWYQADTMGNTSHVTNDAGQILEQYLYDAYGTPTVYNGAGNSVTAGTTCDNRYLFKSCGAYEWLAGLRLYYCRARFYLPQHGRWLQPDPIGQKGGLNIYTYCGNDPINGIDPSGLTVVSVPPASETPEKSADGQIPDRVVINGNSDGLEFLRGGNGVLTINSYNGTSLLGIGGLFNGSGVRRSDDIPIHDPNPGVGYGPPMSPGEKFIMTECKYTSMILGAFAFGPEEGVFEEMAVEGTAVKLANASASAAEGAGTGFRYGGEAEAQVISDTGQIPMVDRFGNAKSVFYTNESFTSAAEAQQALSLPSTPAFRAEFNLGSVRAGYGSIADPMYGQLGGGAEFILDQGSGPISVSGLFRLGP